MTDQERPIAVETCCCREESLVTSCRNNSVYCPPDAQLVKAGPEDLQIVCNEYNIDTIPEVVTTEKEQVLEVLRITQHPEYSPGTRDDFGANKKGPFAGFDISIYHVNDTNLYLEEGELWPACLPRLEEPSTDQASAMTESSKGTEEQKDFFAGWMDPEPVYRQASNQRVANRFLNYFLPRETQVQKVECRDPTWMRSKTYYPPATICYKDPSESSCFQNGNSGSSVMIQLKSDYVNETSYVDAYAFTGPLSMHKGCDQVRKDSGNQIQVSSFLMSLFIRYCWLRASSSTGQETLACSQTHVATCTGSLLVCRLLL